MPYTPTQWEYGDVITAERMNHLEQGVADIMEEVTTAIQSAVLDSWEGTY